jgi:hypothetical protein
MEEDDIMAGTNLTAEEQQNAQSTPADAQPETPAPAPVVAQDEDRSVFRLLSLND